MPVKVRCPGCKKILNAPDKARGKSLKCPNCEGRIRVPAGEAKTAAPARSKAAAPAKKKRPPRPAPSSGEFLGGVNLDRLEDRSANVCPKCGANVYEDDEVCSECGVDLQTGKVREKRKGPDPSRFYGEAWSDSWKFMVENKRLALFSGMVWTLFFVLYVGGSAATAAAHRWETGRVMTAAEEEKTKKGPPKEGEAPVPEMTPERAAVKALSKPPVVVLFFMTVLMYMGMFGWYWFVSAKVIEQTMSKKKLLKMKDVQFDFFSTVITGFKAAFWPMVVLMPIIMPLWLILGVMIAVGSMAFGAAGGAVGGLGGVLVLSAINLLPIFAFPIAQVHMTMPYTYPAFLPWDMLRIFFKNIGPALYWLVMFVAVMSPVFIGSIVLIVMFGHDFGPTIANAVVSTVAWILEKVGEDPTKREFIFKATAFLVATVALVLTSAAIFIPLAFAALFLMRANGLLGFYNRRSLDLVTRTKPNVPCGFWVRYLAAMIDGLLMLIAIILLFVLFDVAATGLNMIGYDFTLQARIYAFIGILLLLPMRYYTKSEAGIFQGTLGKRSLGIKVTNLKGNPVSMKQAMGRFWGKFLSAMLFGAGFIMAGFTEQKQTLHDQLSKSLVVWEGSDDRS